MSVKHLEYLKINNSKVLVVEVRPVKCLLDTPSGPTHTDKWMECSHWKELYHLMTDIVEEYEEQKITQGIKYHQPKCKSGATIQMGYMFRGLPSCWCSLYFLTPRNPCSWTKNDDDRELQDKGGCFEDFTLCGEMLVISVILRDSSPSTTAETAPTPSYGGTFQQACLNHKLIKALDSRATYINSISDYFKTSTASTDDKSAKCVPSSSRGRQRSPSLRVKTSTSCNAEHKSKGDECSEVVKVIGSSDCDSSFSPSRSFSLKEVNSETEEREMDLLCSNNSEQAIFNETKSVDNCVEFTKSNFTMISCKNKNLENNIERPLGPAYQCYDINSDRIYNNFVLFTSESEDVFPNLESAKYPHDTLNDSNVSCSVSAYPCNPLRDSSQLGNVSLEPQTDSFTASNTSHEADEISKFHSVVDDSTLFDVVIEENIQRSEDYCVSHEMDAWNSQVIPFSNCDESEQKMRSWEVDTADESNLNSNELEGQEDTVPYKIHNDCLLETNTSTRKNHRRNSSSPEVESVSTSEDYVIDAENSVNCVPVSEDLSVSVRSEGHVPEIKQVEAANESVFSTTFMKNFHAGNVLEEDLKCCSDSTEKYVGQKMPSTRDATHECLLARTLLTPVTNSALSVHVTREGGSTDESSLSTQNCGCSFVGSDIQSLQQTPKHEYQGAAHLSSKNIVKEVHSSRKTLRTMKSMEITEQQSMDKEQCENFDTPERKCKCQTQNVRKKRRMHESLTKTSQVSDPEDEDKWMRMSCSSIFAVAGENNAKEDFLPPVKELHSDSETHQLKCKLLHDSSAPSSSCQNPCGAISDSAGEVDKESSAQSGLENHIIRCPSNEETAELFGCVGKPEMKLECQGNAPDRADEEYVPPQITCKWKKKKRKKTNGNMPNHELEYEPTSLRNLSATNYESSTVENSVVQEGDLAHNFGAAEAEPVGYPDKLKIELEFQKNAPARADEYIPEKIACNWKKEKSKNMPHLKLEYVPANVRHLSTTNLTHGTQVSKGLPSHVETGNCVSRRTQQQIKSTETCVPLFICAEKNDAGNAFKEDLDPLSVSTENYDSQKIPDTVETPPECVPPQRLVSHLNEENYNKIECPQSFQSHVQSTELNKEPFKRSTIFGQEATQERIKKNHPLKESLRFFRTCKSNQGKYEDETYMKRKGFRSKKAYCNTEGIQNRNTCTDQMEKIQKKMITSHTSASGTAVKSNLGCNENVIGESVLEDNSFDSIPSQNARILSNPSPEQVDAYKGSVQPDLGHELGDSSLQSSTCVLLKQDKAHNVLYDVNQYTKGEKWDPEDREDETESDNLATSNCKNCVQQKTCGYNRKPLLSIGIGNPKMQVNEDDTADRECVSKGVMSPKRKRISVPTNEKPNFLSNKKKSAEKCVTQAEESDQSGQDTVREHMLGESSQNCTPIKMCKNIRLSEETASDLLQSEEHEKESVPRRSNRLKGKIPNISWLLGFSDEDLSEEHIKEKRDIAAETKKSIKFFEKYVKERNANKSVLKQKMILDYVRSCNTLEQESGCEEWSFKSTDKKRSHVITKSKLSRSVKPKSVKNKGTKKLHGQDNTFPELLKPTTSKRDRSERPQFNVEQAALKCHKEICNFTLNDEQGKKRAKSNNKSVKERGKKSSLQEKKKVSSPQKVVRKRVRQKRTLISGTSTVYDSGRDLENRASASEKGALHWVTLAEEEEHDPLVSDPDTVLESNQNCHSSPRTEEKSSESGIKEEQPQPTEKEDEVDVVYSQNLASLKASYRRLQSMTESNLEQRLDENLPFLERVVQGRVPNERHEMFVSSLQQLKQQPDYLICGPFTADQTEHVLELLKKKLSHLDSLFGNVYDLLTYRCRVLMPTFLTKIVMDNENVSLKQAEQLMIKFSLDHNITGTTNTRDWRK